MTQEARHGRGLTQNQLQQSLRMAEAHLFKLLSITVRGSDTISVHDDQTVVPRRSLVLVPDPNGNVGAPAGTDPTPICRGKGYIGGVETKVAAFRKVAAAAAPPPPPGG